MSKSQSIAVVGLEFGAEFAPIYADHPDVDEVTLCDLDPDLLARVSERTGLDRVATELEQVLADDQIDLVHLVTGLPDHAAHAIRALEAGKHVACTVPMALSFQEINAIQNARRASGRNYMMMETAVYTREFLFVAELMRRGWFGDVGYARGTHFQDMSGWPDYWTALPPTYYLTHAVSPLLALLDTRATSVRALGSGHLEAGTRQPYGPSFPVTSALFTLDDHDAALEVTRSLSRLARPYTESFSIYGSHGSFEWAQLESEQSPLLFRFGDDPRPDEFEEPRGRPITIQRPQIEDRTDLLPASLARYCRSFVHEGAGHRSFRQGGGHGGSHPHLVHEFVRSVVEGRPPAVDDVRAARWTAAGIAAHESALHGGSVVAVPALGESAPAAADPPGPAARH